MVQLILDFFSELTFDLTQMTFHINFEPKFLCDTSFESPWFTLLEFVSTLQKCGHFILLWSIGVQNSLAPSLYSLDNCSEATTPVFALILTPHLTFLLSSISWYRSLSSPVVLSYRLSEITYIRFQIFLLTFFALGWEQVRVIRRGNPIPAFGNRPGQL